MNNDENDVSFRDIFSNMRSALLHLMRRWWVILILGVSGAAIGIWYASSKPDTFTAKLSFILEEGKGGGGGLASLAGQFGFDLGGITGNNGPLSADNITLFLTSSSLTEETLLTRYDSAGKYSLADRYAEVTGLKKAWKKNKKIGTEVFFPERRLVPYSRLQDSLLQILIEEVSKKNVVISKPDRKASFIEVFTTMRDESLSKYYCERLVNAALSRYIDIKTNRQSTNVNRLQRRADSIYYLLNRKTYSSAAAQERVLDINPALRSMAAVPTEVISRDKVMLGTLYGEIVKNLEISKVALNQETPMIQVIDNVRLPLKRKQTSKVLYAIVGGFLLSALGSCLVMASFLLSRKNKTRMVQA
jgi:hypothetical protein